MFAGFDVGDKSQVWMSHGDHVETVPPGYVQTARSGSTVAGFRHQTKPIHAVQFHAEVMHSVRGAEMLQNFLFEVCHCTSLDARPFHRPKGSTSIRERVGDAQVICGLSGGVDCAVVAALVGRAIGDQLSCIFVDTGLLRMHEREQVERPSAELSIELRVVRAEKQFLDGTKGHADPQIKRRMIGATLHRRVRGGDRRRRASTRRVPGAGHALPRRDRVRQCDAAVRRRPSRRITTWAGFLADMRSS